MKILVNGWGEDLIKPFSKNNNYLEVVGLKSDKGVDYNDYNSFIKINHLLLKEHHDFVHLNCWFDIFFIKYNKNIKYIFESHAFHPGISLKFSIKITEKLYKKILIFLFYPIFKLLFLYKIRKTYIYFVSIPGLINYCEKYGGIWLPNPIDTNVFSKKSDHFKLDKNYINIFYPTSLREIKNPGFAFDLIEQLIKKYTNVRIYMIRQGVSNYGKYTSKINLLSKYIIWLDPINRNRLPYYYSANWNLVLGSFSLYSEYAILNMIELEAMACKCPIICHDLYETLFIDLDDILQTSFKIIDDLKYRDEYINKNYNYIKSTHSTSKVLSYYINVIGKNKEH